MQLISRRTLLSSAAAAGIVAVGATNLKSASAAPATLEGASVERRRPTITGPTINLGDYCAGDGVTNDAAGFERALAHLASQGGGTIQVPARTYVIQPRGFLQIGDNIAIKGEGSQSRIILNASSSSEYTTAFRVVGSKVVIEDIALVRGNNVYGTFVTVMGNDVWVRNCDLDGKLSSWDNTFHGFYLAGSGADFSGFTLAGGFVRDCSFGLFLSESGNGSFRDVAVSGVTFMGNKMDDLEFCAPLGQVSDILVQYCAFFNNKSKWVGAGFAVGLSNAQSVTIHCCLFADYELNPVHMEQSSRQVLINECYFLRSSTMDTNFASHVIILSGCHDVTIQGNTFDLSANNDAVAVYAGPGGAGQVDPRSVTLQSNKLKGAPLSKLSANYGDQGSFKVSGTQLLGS